MVKGLIWAPGAESWWWYPGMGAAGAARCPSPAPRTCAPLQTWGRTSCPARHPSCVRLRHRRR
eukprot:4034856-Prymnesium_polylepis.1